MPNIAIKKDERIKGSVQDFYKLYIDGECFIDEFSKGLTDQYRSHLRGAYNIMQDVANGRLPPGKKWHKLKGNCELYETKHEKGMRIYCHHRSDLGKTIIFGSFQKTKQGKDISEAERIAQSLPAQIRILENEQDLEDYLKECEQPK